MENSKKSMIWILFCAVSFLFALYITAHLTWRLWTHYLSTFEFANNIPWLGVIPFLDLQPYRLFKQILHYIKKHNHLYVIWHGPKAEIVLGRAEYAQAILRSQKSLTKHGLYSIFSEWLGTGLLFSRNEKWKKRRAALTPAFHFNILQDNIEIYNTHALNLVRHLRAHADTSTAIDIQELIHLATLDVLCETSMGVQIKALDSENKYVHALGESKLLLLNRIFNPLVYNSTIYKLTSNGKKFYKHLATLQNFTIDVINKRIEERAKREEPEEAIRGRRVFLDIILDLYDKGEIDIEGMREEVDTFMFAGHDTTATCMCWTLFRIGVHPDIQERLYEEIDAVSKQDCPLPDKICDLKYTECVIKESLRMYPPLPLFGRTTSEELRVDEHVIPEGTNVAVNLLSVHHNPAYWKDPSEFNPSRFESEDYLKRNPYSYIPFSAGPRNCIGQKFAMLELKVFLYHLVSHYRIFSTQTVDEVQPCFSLTLNSYNGIHLKFYSRQ